MKIIIKNNKHKYITNKEVKYATKWFLDLLVPNKSKRILSKLEIEYHFKNLEHDLGTTDCLDFYDKYPKLFIIEVDKSCTRRKLLHTIAHELVHVKQYALNELRDSSVHANRVKWKKEELDTDKIDYWDTPYEIEAYGREPGLYRRYIEHLRKEKIKFNDK